MDRRIEYVPVEKLVGAKRNPKQHALEDLGESLETFGYTEPVLLDERTKRLVAGHGRVKALKALHKEGGQPPEGVKVDKDGAWLIPVVRGWSSRDDAHADAYLLASNQLTAMGGYNSEMLLQMLTELEQAQALVGTGFGAKDIEQLLVQLQKATEPSEEPKVKKDEVETPEGIDDVPAPPAEPYVKTGETYQLGRHTITCGDSRDVIPKLGAAVVHACVTDPPYEIAFMSKGWDNSGVAYDGKLWKAVLGALPPGGHVLSFGATRTFHRMAVAIEDAGAEIRDTILWLYGSGFPKSHDVSKALDEAAGATREVIGKAAYSAPDTKTTRAGFAGMANPEYTRMTPDITAPATEAAKAWAGWGSALKPACEPCVMARKPMLGTLAANVLDHGTGALNVDGCRIGTDPMPITESTGEVVSENGSMSGANYGRVATGRVATGRVATGRWPANVMLDERAAAVLDEQTKEQTSRFFYVAKASRTERDAGLEDEREHERPDGRFYSGDPNRSTHQKNHHPTVKPVNLMRYLVRLVTPPKGRVLEPFSGSGTTLLACELEGLACTAVEREPAYVQLAIARWEGLTKQKALKVS